MEADQRGLKTGRAGYAQSAIVSFMENCAPAQFRHFGVPTRDERSHKALKRAIDSQNANVGKGWMLPIRPKSDR